MRPLRIALIHRDTPSAIQRLIGAFSYPVPEFTWVHYPVWKRFELDKKILKTQGFDLIIHEDAKAYAKVKREADIPYVYVVRDSTLSDEHYHVRYGQAHQADLVLVDWDRLDRFTGTGKPVRRFFHCVNDLVFRDYGLPRTVDVAFIAHIKGDPAREELDSFLKEFCKKNSYVYRSGSREWMDYAGAFASAKVAINLNRNSTTCSNRVLDAMGGGACLLTSPLPVLEDDPLRLDPGQYVVWKDYKDLANLLPQLLDPQTVRWEVTACNGFHRVTSSHTWRKRAQELRKTLGEVFPWLA